MNIIFKSNAKLGEFIKFLKDQTEVNNKDAVYSLVKIFLKFM